MSKSYMALMHTAERCSIMDKKLRRLLCEKQNMLKELEKKKLGFKEEFLREIKRQKQKTEEEVAVIRQQIAKSKEEATEERQS